MNARHSLSGLACLLLFAAVGCNALLGNEPVLASQDSASAKADAAVEIDTFRVNHGEAGQSSPSSEGGKSGAASSSQGGTHSTAPAAGRGGTAADGGRRAEPSAGAAASSGGAGAAGTASGSGGASAGGDGAAGMPAPMCADLTCPENASCDSNAQPNACHCNPGFDSRSGGCSDIDECVMNLAGCDAHASCVNHPGSYECVCAAPYVGDGRTCNLDDKCQQLRCDANARCAAGACKCIDGFEGNGQTCTRVDPCRTNPCVRGTCASVGNTYYCDCAGTGYMGATCNQQVDDCANRPCKNAGTCQDLLNDYSCTCATGWTGKQCETSTGCDYQGQHYAVNASFPAADGCNTCSCSSAGSVVCTKKACPVSCGGLRGATCPSGQYCNYPVSARCGAADAQGSCEAPPNACSSDSKQVCGCDAKTYANACDAAMHSVSVQQTGACAASGCSYKNAHYDAGASFPAGDGCNTCTCQKDGTVACTQVACTSGCGGLAGTKCPSDQYCSFGVGTCGQGDMTGSCTSKPQLCNQVYMPVCGCDGQTYGNACTAAAAGVSLKTNDACVPP